MNNRRIYRPKLAILTNAWAADQRSMIGYGEMVLQTARRSENKVVEFRSASLFARLLPQRIQGLPRKLFNNVDRFIITPLKLIGRRADIVHIVDPGNVIYLPLIRHRRSIVTVHDMIPYLARDEKLPGWQPTLTGRWLMKRIIQRLSKVDHIVCVSDATKRDVLSYINIPEERLSVIPNAVFQPMKPASTSACADLRARLGLPEDAPLILHVGRNWYKNRETVLDVAANVRENIPEAVLVMVGALTPSLAVHASRLRLGDNLCVLDSVSRADMAILYTTASVLLFPSHYEGFGLPVLEAQMCGTPVVCSDGGALPEVIGNVSNIFLPTDIDGLASKTAKECQVGSQLRVNAASDLPTRFRNTTWSALHQSLYRNALKKSRKGGISKC